MNEGHEQQNERRVAAPVHKAVVPNTALSFTATSPFAQNSDPAMVS